ncbi:outer membrane cobalamin receptor protein [Terriglobus roseus DSM 18391]|uniref:Outer membrane cobalamin receptor protein n=1 Tax=Terriglobus roseus (strain DSM 18391 / NRRL B-41598 / KBS 63) TaxID=926566 RepID=I3ZH47_TERRK|nr:TonB-dependent receptor [Terriglobus roseus]AFL88565.1 outer membrane cobalamin receptor protein [Terriglobus roseus DSM 18391]AFL88906.1 outer membrane cobalamin receptor protein [Terriglobus roseus DSM 18391]
MYCIPRRRARTCVWLAAVLSTTTLTAHAVIIRGSVRDPLGRAIPSARVQLIKGTQVVASTVTLPDGSYEIRSTEDGRFLLLANAQAFAVQVSEPFYGRSLDVVSRDLQMTINPVRSEVTVTATGVPTAIAQTSGSVTIIPMQDLSTRVDVTQELRLQPGVSMVQTGQYGGATSLFVRGGNSDANKVLIDDVPANDVGGVFDFGTVSSTAVRALESHRGPDSVLYGTDARAGVVRFETPHGTAIRPVLTYSGDAGNLHTWRNEATLSGTYGKADYYTAFSRFDTSNALANDRYHSATSAANLGYSFTGTTSIRGTVRNGVSATGLPGPYDFQGLTQVGKQGDQNTYMSGVIDDTRRSGWHNSFRYIGARKREQSQQFASNGTPDGFGTYYGKVVTIRGANGTSATGSAVVGYDPFPTRYELVSNRDGLDYRTDYKVNEHLTVIGGFRFQDERGSYRYPLFGTNQQVGRSNYDYTLQMQGSVGHRVFYTLGGAIQRNSLYGTEGQPQLGLAYYAIQPGTGWFHGTRLRVNFAKGVQEPNLSTQLSSLYAALQGINDTADIAKFRVSPIGAQRSRTYEGGVSQNIYSDRAILHLTYFHSTYGRGIEYVSTSLYNQYFNQTLPQALYGFYLNSLSTQGQGIEAELQYQMTHRLFVRAGYTYLDASVKQSFSTDALQALGGAATVNPKYAGVAIGVSSPLVGQRPFRRAPNTGFFVVQYTGNKFGAALKGAMSSRSDDSTFIDAFSSSTFDNSMLLPNRNLAYGFTKLDASVTYQWRPSIGVFTQAENLLNNQHIGAFGYPGLPLTVRVGLKVRFPAE